MPHKSSKLRLCCRHFASNSILFSFFLAECILLVSGFWNLFTVVGCPYQITVPQYSSSSLELLREKYLQPLRPRSGCHTCWQRLSQSDESHYTQQYVATHVNDSWQSVTVSRMTSPVCDNIYHVILYVTSQRMQKRPTRTLDSFRQISYIIHLTKAGHIGVLKIFSDVRIVRRVQLGGHIAGEMNEAYSSLTQGICWKFHQQYH